MSEFQYIGFRAVDQPVSEADLNYMRRQSSRAKITPWSFDNEYQYGDFHGDAKEMLRRGYDIHLHYANFGIRKLLIRFPYGLPDDKAAKQFIAKEFVQFLKDKQGKGGILSISPFHEPDDLEELWNLSDILDRLVPLRGEVLNGDLRPLYLAHLAMACDGEHDPNETEEAPVPAGLGELTDAQQALAELYGISKALIAAASRDTPALANEEDLPARYVTWLRRLSESTKDSWLAKWMSDPHTGVRAELMAQFQKSRDVPAWPTILRGRTIAELEAASTEVQREADRKSAEKAARQKAKRLAAMAADPAPTLLETQQLVKKRTGLAYEQIANLLADLRESLADTDQADLAEHQARKLKKENPTLGFLTAQLRLKGFLAK